jgi:predicted RNA-binding protein with RPS1 domain
MFEASVNARQFDRGQTIEGTIVAFGPEVAFVNVGGKAEAEIDLAELKDVNGDVEFSVGDRIHAVVVSTSGGIVLSRKGVRNAATQRELEDAFQAGVAVEGKVQNVVKGGYEVRIARERAFCPLSQIDMVRTADPAVHVGQVYAFRIIEYRDGGKNIVVSRRKHLEEQQRASAADVRKSIVPGAVLTGRVASVPAFGAFVDLGGGIQGLLHVSEMGWSRVTNPYDIVAIVAGARYPLKAAGTDLFTNAGGQRVQFSVEPGLEGYRLLDDGNAGRLFRRIGPGAALDERVWYPRPHSSLGYTYAPPAAREDGVPVGAVEGPPLDLARLREMGEAAMIGASRQTRRAEPRYRMRGSLPCTNHVASTERRTRDRKVTTRVPVLYGVEGGRNTAGGPSEIGRRAGRGGTGRARSRCRPDGDTSRLACRRRIVECRRMSRPPGHRQPRISRRTYAETPAPHLEMQGTL